MMPSTPGWLTPEDQDIMLEAMIRTVCHAADPATWQHDSLRTLSLMVDGDRRDAGQTVARGAARAAASRIVQFHAMQDWCLQHPNAVY